MNQNGTLRLLAMNPAGGTFGCKFCPALEALLGAGYNIPAIRGRGRTVATNHVWGAPFRACGSPQAFLASESLVDELAEKVGMDPLEFRYLNVYWPGDTTPTGQAPKVYSLPEMLAALACISVLGRTVAGDCAQQPTAALRRAWANHTYAYTKPTSVGFVGAGRLCVVVAANLFAGKLAPKLKCTGCAASAVQNGWRKSMCGRCWPRSGAAIFQRR